MFQPVKIRGVIFDYGGTIDSNGMHWAEVLWKAYEALQVPISKDLFREAYIFAERTLGKNPIVRPHHTFLDMLNIKCSLQIDWLMTTRKIDPAQVTPATPYLIANWCYDYAKYAIEAARPILNQLSVRYPMALVSNFYGNIEAVLKDFGLDNLFFSIVESAVVGIRKPNPDIFRMGIERLNIPADEVAVIGDSYDKDIVPARFIGCQTIWLKSIGWEPYSGKETANAIITDFRELSSLFLL